MNSPRIFQALLFHAAIKRRRCFSVLGEIRIPNALRTRFSSIQHALLSPHSSQKPTASIAADVTLFLEDAVSSGQLSAAVSLLEAASEAEFSASFTDASSLRHQSSDTQTHLVTPYHLKRLLSAAAFQQDSRVSLVISDRLVALALKSPTRRVDAGVIETYASLVGGLASGPDHVRGFAFCSLMESSGMRSSGGSSPFACYAAAVASCHGPLGMKACIRYAAARERGSLSSEAWLALLGQGSDGWGALEKVALTDVRSVFRKCLAAADDELGGASTSIDELGATIINELGATINQENTYNNNNNNNVSSTVVVPNDIETDELLLAASRKALDDRRRSLRVRAHDTFAQVLASRGEVVEAAATCSAAHSEGLFLLSGPSTVLNAAILKARGSFNATDRSKFVNAALEVYPSALSSGKILSSASAQLMDLLCEDYRLQDALNVANLALNESINLHRSTNDDGRTGDLVTSASFPIDTIALERLLSQLTSAGKSAEARSLFTRMQSAFARMGPPSQRAFNLILRHYAIAHDVVNAQLILEQMSLAGHVPDANSLSALAHLRGDMNRLSQNAEQSNGGSGNRKSSQSQHWKEEEVDGLVQRLCDGNATVVRSDQTVPFNEALCAYFRLRRPQKAFELAAKMPALGLAPKADTINTVILGLLYSGGSLVHGMDASLVPMQWGGEFSQSSEDRSSRRFSVHPTIQLKAGGDRGESFHCADLTAVAQWLFDYKSARKLHIQQQQQQRQLDSPISVDDILKAAASASAHTQEKGASSSLLNPRTMVATRAAIRLLLHFKIRKSNRSEPSIFSLDSSDALSMFHRADDVSRNEDISNPTLLDAAQHDYLPLLPSLLASHFHSASGLKRHQQVLNGAVFSKSISNSILVNAAKVREDFINSCDHMVQSALHRVSPPRALQLFLTLYLTGALGGNSHSHSGGTSSINSSTAVSTNSSNQIGGTAGLGFALPAVSSSSAGSSLCSASLINTCVPSLYALDLRGSPPDVSALFAMVALTELAFTSVSSSRKESTSMDANATPLLKANKTKTVGLLGKERESSGTDLLALLTGNENSRTTVRVSHLFLKEMTRKVKKNKGGLFLESETF